MENFPFEALERQREISLDGQEAEEPAIYKLMKTNKTQWDQAEGEWIPFKKSESQKLLTTICHQTANAIESLQKLKFKSS